MIDIVFVCDKWEDFMLDTVYQPLKYSGNRVNLISTPEILARFDNSIVKHNIREYENTWLKEHYVHRSPNYYAMELHCMQRWNVLKSFMRAVEMNFFFTCDTDVLVFNDMEDVSYMERGVFSMSTASGHCPTMGACFWLDVNALECYTEYIHQYYEYLSGVGRRSAWIDSIEKSWDSIKENPSGGGISDMFFAGIMRDYSPFQYFDTSKVFNGQTLDHNLMAQYDDYEFDADKRIKKLYKIDGQPHFKKSTGELVRASTLHCSQHAKHLIHDIAEGRY